MNTVTKQGSYDSKRAAKQLLKEIEKKWVLNPHVSLYVSVIEGTGWRTRKVRYGPGATKVLQSWSSSPPRFCPGGTINEHIYSSLKNAGRKGCRQSNLLEPFKILKRMQKSLCLANLGFWQDKAEPGKGNQRHAGKKIVRAKAEALQVSSGHHGNGVWGHTCCR